MAELLQNLANTNQIETALDIGDKYRGKMKKLQTFDSSYFISKSYFDDNRSQNY